MQIFVDMDGVLADFASGYQHAFGHRPSVEKDDVDWAGVRAMPGFFEGLPPMPDMTELWTHVAPYRPIVLTGVPSSVPEAPENKRAWVRRHLGTEVVVRCCRSKEKSLHAQPGDILIDDWDKYRDLWIAQGGRWITHRSAAVSIQALRALGVL